MMLEKQEIQLEKSLLDFMELWKGKPGNEIMVLHKIQEIYGYVPRKVAMEVSRLMGIPLAKIYGIITIRRSPQKLICATAYIVKHAARVGRRAKAG